MSARLKRLVKAALAVAVCAAVGLALRTWVVGLARIAGASMNDTLVSGDVVLVTRLDYLGAGPGFGDIVECRLPGRGDTYVKRVIGLPGDEIAFRGGALLRNGAGVSEPYVSSPTEDYEIQLGENQYLLLGDNRAQSYDSRMNDIGPVGRDAFLGRARLIVWPPRRIGSIG